MRLSPEQIALIRRAVEELASPQATARLFGSRLVVTAKGADVNLLLELPEPVRAPAMLASALTAAHAYPPQLERMLATLCPQGIDSEGHATARPG